MRVTFQRKGAKILAYQITKVRVEAPGTHEQHITKVKLSDGTEETREQVHNFIASNLEYYYTVGGGRRAEVEAATSSLGTKFIRTKADSTTKDNLLSLPRF